MRRTREAVAKPLTVVLLTMDGIPTSVLITTTVLTIAASRFVVLVQQHQQHNKTGQEAALQ